MSPRSLRLASLTGIGLVVALVAAVSAAGPSRPSEREPKGLHDLMAHHVERVTRVAEHIHAATPKLREAEDLVRRSLLGNELTEQEKTKVDDAVGSMADLQSEMEEAAAELQSALAAWNAAAETEAQDTGDETTTSTE